MQTSKAIIAIIAGVLLISLACIQPQEDMITAEPRISPSTHYFAGQMLERQKDFLGAIHQFQLAIEADSSMAKAYNRLAMIHQHLGRPLEAQKALMDGIQENPESAVLRNNFGYFCMSRGDFGGAEQQFQAALGLTPGFIQARMNLAIVLARTKRYEQSVQEFNRVVPAEMAYFNVAVVCVDNENYMHAEWALRHAIEIDPDFEDARSHLPHVARLARESIDKSINADLDVEAVTWACCSVDEPVQVTTDLQTPNEEKSSDLVG